MIQLLYHLGIITNTSFQDEHYSLCLFNVFVCHQDTIVHPKGDSVGPGTPKEVRPLSMTHLDLEYETSESDARRESEFTLKFLT